MQKQMAKQQLRNEEFDEAWESSKRGAHIVIWPIAETHSHPTAQVLGLLDWTRGARACVAVPFSTHFLLNFCSYRYLYIHHPIFFLHPKSQQVFVKKSEIEDSQIEIGQL